MAVCVCVLACVGARVCACVCGSARRSWHQEKGAPPGPWQPTSDSPGFRSLLLQSFCLVRQLSLPSEPPLSQLERDSDDSHSTGLL